MFSVVNGVWYGGWYGDHIASTLCLSDPRTVVLLGDAREMFLSGLRRFVTGPEHCISLFFTRESPESRVIREFRVRIIIFQLSEHRTVQTTGEEIVVYDATKNTILIFFDRVLSPALKNEKHSFSKIFVKFFFQKS